MKYRKLIALGVILSIGLVLSGCDLTPHTSKLIACEAASKMALTDDVEQGKRWYETCRQAVIKTLGE